MNKPMSDVAQLLSKGLDSLSLQDVERVTPRLSETLIANQLNQLSMNEREHVLQDIHGVADLVHETPQLIEESLQLLQYEFHQQYGQRLKTHASTSLWDSFSFQSGKVTTVDRRIFDHDSPEEITPLMSPSSTATAHSSQTSTNIQNLLINRDFCLSFLRAERFDIPKTADRILKFLDEKERLFGPSRVFQPITMQDLDKESFDCLQCGRMQLLPGRDRAGRAILVGVRKLQKDYKNEDSLVRAFWYFASIAAEDKETQQKGVVVIQYNLGIHLMTKSAIHKLGRVLRALPLRVVSIHACVNDKVTKAAATVAALLIGANNTIRFRCHSGSDMEVQYDLMTFGIPVHLLPISPTGDANNSRHRIFLEQRQNQERLQNFVGSSQNTDDDLHEHLMDLFGDDHDGHNMFNLNNTMDISISMRSYELQTQSVVLVPSELDILLGRGKGPQNHKGNLRYRQIVESYRDRYEQTKSKRDKTQLIKEVVQVVYKSGGRFLQQDPLGRWIPVDDDNARDKVSHSFRNQKRLSKKEKAEATSKARIVEAHGRIADGQSSEKDNCERDSKRARNIESKL